MSGVDVVIIGVGLVGSAVIRQLSSTSSLSSLHVVALQNSKKTLFASPGKRLMLGTQGEWKAALDASPVAALPLPELVKHLQELQAQNQRHMVVVDNTSDDGVASFYPSFVQAGFSIATPNKKAFSGSLELYAHILHSALQPGVAQKGPLVYQESTVGAGLPIISTLDELVVTGDKIKKIEGVFSGTMSYIFNEFSPPGGSTRKFSEIVTVARERGYTEPNPGDDLSGSDVARKLTILSRLIPELANVLPEGYTSVDTQSLTPEGLRSVTDAETYVRRLPEFDAEFDELRAKAQANNSVLRYVGVIDVEKRVIRAGLEAYPADHPFATSLGGSDNIISFSTERYSPRPLLVQGAGAGAEVTAMGVVGDLVRIAQRRM
ncbi:homoserine dehydrogenase [Malassezia brasiliensis]|uniref:Homoserine dehydrogenase n=1 Tax=Malassezia brasiliensis TaxID=1821822 RepID=A0AAF0DTG1_9BASI|nr:homoserine dehydrogenase [Malassezia brasiliensis]